MQSKLSEYSIMVVTTKAKSKGVPDEHLVYSDHLEDLAQKMYGSLNRFEIYGGVTDTLHDCGVLQHGDLDSADVATVDIDCKQQHQCFIEDVSALIHDMINRNELPAGKYKVRVRPK